MRRPDVVTIVKQTFFSIAVEPFACFRKNLAVSWKRNRKKTGILLGVWFTLLILLGVILFAPTKDEAPQIVPAKTDNTLSLISDYDPALPHGNLLVDEAKKLIKPIYAIFNNYILITPDPTGGSRCSAPEGGGVWCQLYAESDLGQPDGLGGHIGDYVNFNITGSRIKSTRYLSSLLFDLTVLTGFILISIQAFNMITEDRKSDLRGFILRILGGLSLLIGTKYLLSLSIILTNLLSSRIMNNSGVEMVVDSLFDAIEKQPQDGIWDFVVKVFNSGFQTNFFSQIQYWPLIFALGLLFLMLLYIAFQLIIRFLNLFFLSAVYPMTAVFALHPKTEGIVNGFWKQWTTFLIQQPVFILGFRIMNDMLGELFTSSTVDLDELIILIGFLLFISTMNILAAKLWGDAFSAVSQNITAGLAAGALKSTLIDKPLAMGKSLLSRGSGNENPLVKLENTNNVNLNTDFNLGEAKKKSDQSADKSDPAEVLKKKSGQPKSEDNRSPLMKELSGSGYAVTEADQGKLNVSGQFVTGEIGDSGVTTLFTNKEAALKAGVPQEDLQEISLNNLSVQDASNTKMTRKYNDWVKDFAADNNGHAANTGISYVSNDKKVQKSMAIAESANLQRGIQAVAVKNDLPQGDKSIKGDNVLKFHTYSQVLKNKL